MWPIVDGGILVKSFGWISVEFEETIRRERAALAESSILELDMNQDQMA